MQIRPAIESDITAIVALLKVSLGESLMPKSEHYWRWKHLENPFGPSPVLICMEGDKLIGVRAFMRWEWKGKGRVFKAVRAVDTATHPEHQGKGIFKKLTLALIEYCKETGDDFVFNTPNQQSKPGYLKMGWQEAGRLPITISMKRPLHIVWNLLAKSHQEIEHHDERIGYYLNHPGLAVLIGNYSQPDRMTSNVSVAYLKWRYLNVPVARYVALGDEQDNELKGLIIGRVKNTRLGTEFRITDCFLRHDNTGEELIRQLRHHRKTTGIDYCTMSGTASQKIQKIAGRFHWKAFVGPTVTIRSINLSDLSNLQSFNGWSPSIGDLELF